MALVGGGGEEREMSISSNNNTRFERVTSDRIRVCRICAGEIEKKAESIVLKDCKLPGKISIDLHFHPDCLNKSLEEVQRRQY
jgi:hypothetical protein